MRGPGLKGICQLGAMEATEGLVMARDVLLVALLLLLLVVLLFRMARAMRKHEVQGMFTEFASDQDFWEESDLVVRFKVERAPEHGLNVQCEWCAPNGEKSIVWNRNFEAGTHEMRLDTRNWPVGRNSYRLVTPQQVLERFVTKN